MQRILSLVLAVFIFTGCTNKVEISTKDPIVINLNLKIDHEIKIKVDKELDDVFSDDSDIF